MKNVLIISFYFSENEIIGSHRARGLAKFLIRYGWHPIVVTRKTDHPLLGNGYDLIEVPFNSLRTVWKKGLGWEINKTISEQKGLLILKNRGTGFSKAMKIFEDIALFPDDANSWISGAERAITDIMGTKKIDAMISTSSPVSDHFIAHNIKRKFGLPWLADYRDLWSQNHYRDTWIRNILNAISERLIISNADMLSTVSEPLAIKLKSLFPSKRVIPILNGYDPDDIIAGILPNTKFSIVHTGSLYRGRRDPDLLFKAIQELVAEGRISINDINIDFYGPSEDWLVESATNYGLEKVVRMHGTISRKEVLMEQRKAQILLLLTWDNPAECGVYTGKIFEYIAAKRPILLLGSTNGVASELLTKTGAGHSASNVNTLKEILYRYYCEYVNTGVTKNSISTSNLDNLSQIRMAKEFSTALSILHLPE